MAEEEKKKAAADAQEIEEAHEHEHHHHHDDDDCCCGHDHEHEHHHHHHEHAAGGHSVKRVYTLQNVGCAHCAAKMEDAIRKIDGVQDVSVNFMTQKLTLVCEEADLDGILKKAVTVCKKIEPDCTILVK